MLQIIYLSTASVNFEDSELKALLEKARKFNSEHNVSGLLLYKDGTFLQVLEGEAQIVESLYSKIAVDSRHQQIDVLGKYNIEKRSFSEWSMAFHDFSQQPLEIDGQKPFEKDKVLASIRENFRITHLIRKFFDYF